MSGLRSEYSSFPLIGSSRVSSLSTQRHTRNPPLQTHTYAGLVVALLSSRLTTISRFSVQQGLGHVAEAGHPTQATPPFSLRAELHCSSVLPHKRKRRPTAGTPCPSGSWRSAVERPEAGKRGRGALCWVLLFSALRGSLFAKLDSDYSPSVVPQFFPSPVLFVSIL